MPGCFRLTKSKFQILSILSIFSILVKISFYSIFSLSKFFQICQIFQLPIFSFFSKFFLYPLIWFLPRAVVFFSKMIVRYTKILLLFQILAVVFSWDWSWEIDRSWSGPYQKFLKLENFSRYLQLGKELEGWDYLNFKLPKISKFWKSWEFLLKCKKIEKLENSGGAEICRERTKKSYIPKKSSFFSPLIRSGPA